MYKLELKTPLTKQLDVLFTVPGTNTGGRDTGSYTASSEYFIWLIRRNSDGLVDAIISLSKTAPTMPSGYTYKALLRGIRTNATPAIVNNQWLITDVVNDRSSRIVVTHELSSGTNGGTATAGAWRTRVLNTVKINEIVGASLASNQITIPAGIYYVNSTQTSCLTSGVQSRVYDITNSVAKVYGVCDNYSGANGATVVCDGYFTLAAAAALELQLYPAVTGTTTGFGTANTFGVNELFATIEIIKVG